MNGLATQGMSGPDLLAFIRQLAESIYRVSGRRAAEIVVSDLEVLRPVCALLCGVPDRAVVLRGGWIIHGLPVRVDPHCPPDTLYLLPF